MQRLDLIVGHVAPAVFFKPNTPFYLPDQLVELMLRLTRLGRVAVSTLNHNDHSRLITHSKFSECNYDVQSLWP